jgi:hypothetical protein
MSITCRVLLIYFIDFPLSRRESSNVHSNSINHDSLVAVDLSDVPNNEDLSSL